MLEATYTVYFVRLSVRYDQYMTVIDLHQFSII